MLSRIFIWHILAMKFLVDCNFLYSMKLYDHFFPSDSTPDDVAYFLLVVKYEFSREQSYPGQLDQ